VQADASRGGRPPLNNPGVRLPARPATRGAFVTPCGPRTVRTRPPWREPSFRRRPVGSSSPPVVPQRFGCLGEPLPVGFLPGSGMQAAESGEKSGWFRLAAGWQLKGFSLQRVSIERVSPARLSGVSGSPCRRTRQGADARPLTIPASGCLRAPLCGVPSSRPAAHGPSGRALPGASRPFADVLSAHSGLRLFLSASDASHKPSSVIFLCFFDAAFSVA